MILSKFISTKELQVLILFNKSKNVKLELKPIIDLNDYLKIK